MRHALHRQVIWCLQWWIVNKDCVTTLKSYYCICLIRWIIWIWGIVCHRREKTWWVELRLLCSAEQCSTWQRQWPMNEDQNGFSLTNLIPKISIKRLIIDMGSLPGWIIPNDWVTGGCFANWVAAQSQLESRIGSNWDGKTLSLQMALVIVWIVSTVLI